MKLIYIIILSVIFLIVAAGIAGWFLVCGCQSDACLIFQWQKVKVVNDFERCAQLGFPVMESYPRQCRAGDKSFVENVSPSPSPIGNDKIKVSTPLSGAIAESPLKITGEARGTWYFEASFPVKLFDGNGKELAVAPAQAEGDWMTTDFVPFAITLVFDVPQTATGTLVLIKDNPSGLPQNADSVSIPVRFNVESPVIGTGILQGTMTIGPICPVERPDQPCLPTAEMFAARKIYVYEANRTTIKTTLTTDAQGKFKVTLPVGDYWVDMIHQGIGATRGVPAEINIKSGATLDLNIDVDTGIR